MVNIQALRRLIQQVLLVDLGSFLVWNVAEALMVDGTITSHIARLIVREYHPVDIVATPVSALSSPPSDPPRHACVGASAAKASSTDFLSDLSDLSDMSDGSEGSDGHLLLRGMHMRGPKKVASRLGMQLGIFA